MRIRNTHELGGPVELPSLDLVVDYGEEIELDDATAEALLTQGSNWTPVDPDPNPDATEPVAAARTRGGK